MGNITRRRFTEENITDNIWFTVEQISICSQKIKNEISIGDCSSDYSCVLYDSITEQVYGYILARENNIANPKIYSQLQDENINNFINQSRGLEIVDIVVDERLIDTPILYLLNIVHKQFCRGDYKRRDLYIWTYYNGEMLFCPTWQENGFWGLNLNNLSKLLYDVIVK